MQRIALVYGFDFNLFGGHAKAINAQCDIEGSDFLIAYCGRHVHQMKKNIFADDETQPYLIPKNLNKNIKVGINNTYDLS